MSYQKHTKIYIHTYRQTDRQTKRQPEINTKTYIHNEHHTRNTHKDIQGKPQINNDIRRTHGQTDIHNETAGYIVGKKTKDWHRTWPQTHVAVCPQSHKRTGDTIRAKTHTVDLRRG